MVIAVDHPAVFRPGSVPQQKSLDVFSFPFVVFPGSSFDLRKGSHAVAQAIKDNKIWLEDQLHRCGAILLRGFPLLSASDFNEMVEAFGYEELPYVGGAAPRTNVVGRVFTSNESPPDKIIPFHHEMAQVSTRPDTFFERA